MLITKKFLIKNRIVTIIISIFCFLVLSNKGMGSELDNNYALIHYTNPKREFYIPFRVWEVVHVSRHKFLVGNEEILKEIRKSVTKLKLNSENKKSGYPGYFMGLTLYEKSMVQYNLYIERDRSFLLETPKEDIRGVMNEKSFNNFVSLCERMTNIIDYNYQWERLH